MRGQLTKFRNNLSNNFNVFINLFYLVKYVLSIGLVTTGVTACLDINCLYGRKLA